MTVTSPSLWSNRPFLLVWCAGIFAVLGFSMLFLTTSWYIIEVLQEPAFVGVVLTVITVPRVIMMIVGGVIADRAKKSLIMFTTNLLQTLLIATLAYLVAIGELNMLPLLLLTFLFGVFDAFFYPAVMALIPVLVGEHNLQRANSLFHGMTELMFLLGPLIAGLLLTVSTFTITFGAAAALVALSTVFVYPAFIGDQKANETTEATSVKTDITLGLRYVRNSKIITSGTLAIILVNLFVIGPMLVSFPLIVDAQDGTALDLSLLEVGLSIGTFLASFVVYLIAGKKNRGRIVLLTLVASMIAFFVFSLLDTLAGLIVLAAITGFGCMLVYLPTLTIIQENTPKDRLGRVMSIVTISSEGFAPVAFALVSVLVGLGWTISTVLTAAALLGFLCSVWLFLKAKTFTQAA